ncbi:MAG: hypothetical protein D6798_14520 [Deltaproteobacteria bacterium]|nr:MAG: hypothetical protein D6798_14520 [Deltaproteobacteria bacterium]
MSDSELVQVTFISRHSVRAPLQSELDAVAPFVTRPWPEWDVPAAQLSAHGRAICRHLGRWWRDFYGPQLSASGPPSDWIYLRADSLQRDIDTGVEWLRGFLGDDADTVPVDHLPLGESTTYDPIFMPITTGMVQVGDVRTSLLGRMGGSLDTAIRSIRRPLKLIQDVLGTAIVQPELYGVANEIEADGTVRGTLMVAQIASDMFIMQRADGWDMQKVAWGRIDQADLLDIARTRAFVDNLLMRSPMYARAQASNLLAHILAGMDQAITGRQVPGMPFGPEKRLVGWIGHDTNVEAVGSLLGVSWIPDGWVQFQAPPAGAHVFELRRDRHSDRYFVRLYFVSMTLDQMALGAPLTLESPPGRGQMSFPHHDRFRSYFDIPFPDFRLLAGVRIDPRAVSGELGGFLRGLRPPRPPRVEGPA